MNARASPQAAAQGSRYGECERARNGEAHPCGQADDGATTSPPRESVREWLAEEKQRAHRRHGGTAWRHYSDGFIVAVKAARPERSEQAAAVEVDVCR
ncbi:hypothetical protein ACX43S_19680 [Enterobacter cloacae]